MRANPAMVGAQLGLVELRARDFPRAAKLFAASGQAPLAEQYAAYKGKGLAMKFTGKDSCKAEVPLLAGLDAPVVKAAIDGEELNLLVDTSVSGVVVDTERAIKLLISTDSTSQLGGQGPPVGHGRADKLTLGEVELSQVPTCSRPR